MKLESFLATELKDDEMIVINGGLSSLTGGDWCGIGYNEYQKQISL